MANFPGVDTPGSLSPIEAARPIARYDVAPIAAAGARLGAGVEQLGEGVDQYAHKQARLQFMTAHADFLAQSIALTAQFANDRDYATLPDRYAAAASQLRDSIADSIGTPGLSLGSTGLRDRFKALADENIARGTAEMQARAFGLSNAADVAGAEQRGQALSVAFSQTQDENQRHQIIGTYGAMVDALAAKGAVTAPGAFEMKQRFGDQLAAADGAMRVAHGDAQGVINDLRTAPSSPDQIDNRIVQVESNGNPLARNGASNALGLGQFEPATWLSLVRQAHPEYASLPDNQVLALRADPTLSREMVTLNREQNASYLQGKGVDASAGNVYLAHFLGPAGAAAMAKAAPNMPASLVLSQTVGAAKAAAMVSANPGVLAGMTAGSVVQWAHDRMGGVGPGGGHLYDLLSPQARADLMMHAEAALQKQTIDDRADFAGRVQDAVSEAWATGAVSKPLTQEDFIARFGPGGLARYQAYDAQVQAGHATMAMANMTPDERAKTLNSLRPQPGEPAFAVKQQAFDTAAAAYQKIDTELRTDPAAYAVARLPAVSSAYSVLSQKLSDPTASEADRAAAARDYATKQTMEQQRVGVAPGDVKILPSGYVEALNKTITQAATADDPQARIGVIGRVQQEAALWGDNWPSVMRQLAPGSQPLVRAIAAGADPTAMTRLLSVDPKEKPAAVLKEQNTTKAGAVTQALNDAFAPLRSTMVGRQLDRDYRGYLDLGNNLAALYVRDGMDANAAAAKAFKDQANQTQNGIYNVGTGQWAASSDFQNNTQLAEGLIVPVSPGGQANGSTAWQLITANPIVLGSSNIVFVAFVVAPRRATTWLPESQVYLEYVSPTTAALMPRKGSAFVIDGVVYSIPAEGINCGLTNVYIGGVPGQNAALGAVYDLCLANIGTVAAPVLVPDLYLTTTGTHMADTTAGNVGVEVLSSSGVPVSSRSYIGKIATDPNVAGQFRTFTDQQGNVYGQGVGVISWFKRSRQKWGWLVNATGYATNSWVELTTTAPAPIVPLRMFFLTFGDEAVEGWGMGNIWANQSGGASAPFMSIFIDGLATEASSVHWSAAASYQTNGATNSSTGSVTWQSGLGAWSGKATEGQHYFSPWCENADGDLQIAANGGICVFVDLRG